MSVQWTQREPQPDVPVVDRRLWRGVAFALPLSAAIYSALYRLVLVAVAVVRWAS